MSEYNNTTKNNATQDNSGYFQDCHIINQSIGSQVVNNYITLNVSITDEAQVLQLVEQIKVLTQLNSNLVFNYVKG